MSGYDQGRGLEIGTDFFFILQKNKPQQITDTIQSIYIKS